MSSIFISYRRNGALVHARALFERLRHEFGSTEVFIDLDQIEYGADFVEILNAQLNGCRVMLAMIDPEWATATDKQGRRRIDREADYVRVEIVTALERGIRTVPVLIDGAEIPDAEDLPPPLRPLVRRNALMLDFNRFDAEVTRLITAIRQILAAPSPTDIDKAKRATEEAAAREALRLEEALQQERRRVGEEVRRKREAEALRKRQEAEAVRLQQEAEESRNRQEAEASRLRREAETLRERQSQFQRPPFNFWRFYFSARGRASRREFWLYMALPFCVAGIVLVMIASGSPTNNSPDGSPALVVVGLLVILLTWSYVVICIKRLHDAGKGGWWAIFACIPYLSLIACIWFGVTRGQEGKNSYGEAPQR